MKHYFSSTLCATVLLFPVSFLSAGPVNNGGALIRHTFQDEIPNLSLDDLRTRGMEIFSTPFTKADGFGDGPAGATPEERSKNGSRPSINANGTFSRLNGLDAQTCLECHSVLSRATIPMKFGIGGVGGINNSPVGGATFYNVNDDPNQVNFNGPTTGKGNINGRVINPPFLFGSGAVELLANEMTDELQKLARSLRPYSKVSLDSKGINFGILRKDKNGDFDTSDVVGIENDPDSENFLVVQPFGRKGNNKTTRTFDLDAMQFHMGMQSDEVLYKEQNGIFPPSYKDGSIDIDGDGDKVSGELWIGDMSVLSVFNATLEAPFEENITNVAGVFAPQPGRELFSRVGCAFCHSPQLHTNSSVLGLRYPEIAQEPYKNVYIKIDLAEGPTSFDTNRQGGISVPLFADLKTHDMGPELAEASGDSMFTTMRLWGVADTAPYLHDGRALTIREAIDLHGQPGSEAEFSVRVFFDRLTQDERDDIYNFLGTLRTPKHPAEDIL